MARPDDEKPELVRNVTRRVKEETKADANDMAKEVVQDLYGISRAKRYPLERRDQQQLAYSRLMDHLDDIESRNRVWGKYVARALELFLFCGLVAALVCSLAVEPTNRKRLLRLRIWQWVTMALMITAIFSVVPFLTCLLSWPFKLLGRSRKYWVYYLRKMKRSVDFTLWSCLVLSGWYVWFRPRLKHVYGDVSVVACQQITRLLIALCIGFLLWTFKKALYLKLEADLHYDQLFDRIRQTIVFLNGLRILDRQYDPPPPDFLAYDEEARDDFAAVCEEKDATRRRKLMVKYVMKRKWKNWCIRFKLGKKETRTGSARCCNIWMDVLKMRRESVPIWILERLSKEYLQAMKSIRPPNAEELINDDELLLEKAKHMFISIRDITASTKQDIDQFDEIKEEDVAKYNLSEEELAYLFKIKQHEDDEIKEEDVAKYNLSEEELAYFLKIKQHEDENGGKQKQAEENNNCQVEENNKTQQQAEANSHTQQATPNRTPYKPIEVDRFLEWAVRVHKNCWGLERTLKSSKIAFVKLNRMLSTFLVVLVVIIWLLLSKIVNTGQLALLFAPFLAASFMFENSSKNLFQGIIFAFAMHPFDVGDRVIIEDIQMRVKEVNILTSVFYKYDTGAEVIFPNSKLATTKIVNLDITPDQSDKLDFIISYTTPLENIRDLELTIQKLLDDDLYYAAGTKVVKNTCPNPENPLELHMSVHFKYLVSYLTAQKKAGRRSEILSKIMRFRKEMELKQNMKEYPLHFIPYDLELKTNKKVLLLLGIQRMKREILNSFFRLIYIDPHHIFSMGDASTKAEPWKDSNHPLFLHHSDQPGAVLVSQPLVEDNFYAWQESMLMALTIKNKSGFVTGSLPKPSDKPTEELQWERCNVLVKTWLLGSMSKEISKSVIHCKDARSIWLELEERFSQSNIVSLFNIEKEIHGCSQGPNSVNAYFTTLKSLWDEKDALTGFPKCSCAATAEIKTFISNQKTMQFLMGLNPEYEQTRSNIIGLEPFPEPNKAYSMVLRQEQQAKINTVKPSQPIDASAFSVKRPRDAPVPNSKLCEKCGLTNHITKHCRAHLTCSFCNIKGHTADYCRKKKKSMEAGQKHSNALLTDASSNSSSGAQLSSVEYQQVLALLSRLQLPESIPSQPPGSTDSIYRSSANQVGNPSTYDNFSGPSHGEDDWDGI